MDSLSSATNTTDSLLSEAYISGRRSGLRGNPSSLNPHPTGTLFEQWQQGWLSGFRELAYDDAMRCAA